ncbi:MAG: hypothetical protein H7234_03685 [Herminiimonas sp.]|nr:hypothetical protein [Herminiimonas sp.]
MKLGLWLLIAVVAFIWFNHAKKQRLKNRMRGTARAAADVNADAERILACAHCGLHVPASDALVDTAGARFCCEAHRRLHSNA